MSGYFSQLANHTGLGFEPSANRTASNTAGEPTGAANSPESGPPTPPHVEEITLTAAPASDAIQGRSEGPAALVDRRASGDTTDARNSKRTESMGDDQLRIADATAKQSIDVSPGPFGEEGRISVTDSDSATTNRQERSVEVQSPVGGDPVVRLDEPSRVDRRPSSQESIAIPHESIEMVDSRIVAREPLTQARYTPRPEATDLPRPLGDLSPADAIRDQHAERGTIVRSYLKEVRAWVSAPPEFDQQEPEWQRDAERVPLRPPTERSTAVLSDVFDLEPEVQSTPPRAGRREAPEVQDLSLSIGTISIVIEEPKQTAPVAPPAPARVNSSPDRPASEPIRLSRYYL